MASPLHGDERRIVILGTGGTIAGTARDAADNVGYSAAQIGVAQLVAAVPALAAVPIEAEQVAQLDSKDMTAAVWQALVQRIDTHRARAGVAGVVVTHGTDTLEETAWLLHHVLAPGKPVVLTAAMRPATSLQADGPQNLCDAVAVAGDAAARGVLVVLGGRVWAGHEIRKIHSYRLDAFDSGDAGPVAVLEEGRLRIFRRWPEDGAGAGRLPADGDTWPWVEIVTSHAGAGGRGVDALVAAGVRGLVVATTGNGTVHVDVLAALVRAQAAGVQVLRATRCAFGGIVGAPADGLPSAGGLTPAQARVALSLQLMGR
jgi:L-asparaginase